MRERSKNMSDADLAHQVEAAQHIDWSHLKPSTNYKLTGKNTLAGTPQNMQLWVADGSTNLGTPLVLGIATAGKDVEMQFMTPADTTNVKLCIGGQPSETQWLIKDLELNKV